MNTDRRRGAGRAPSLVVLLFLIVSGCQTSAGALEAPTQDHGVDRESAVASARRDAWLRYREIPVSAIEAQRLGAFWIVELRSPSGAGLRYAISTVDGRIRERNLFQ